MKLSKPVLIIALVACYIGSSAQNLLLTKGNRTKEFGVGKIIGLKTSNSQGTFDKRNFEWVLGELVSVEEDEITILLLRQSNMVSDGKKSRFEETKIFDTDTTRHTITLSKSNIKNIAVWGNREEVVKNRTNWAGIGSLAFGIGLIMPWFAVGVDDEDKQEGIMIAAVSMLFAGAVTNVIATPNILITSNDLRTNKKRKYWKVQ